MTKSERAAMQSFFNKISEFDEVSSQTLTRLKDLNEAHGDGSRWCGWEANLEGLLRTLGPDHIIYRRANATYERYLEARARHDLLMEFGQVLADLGFWKK